MGSPCGPQHEETIAMATKKSATNEAPAIKCPAIKDVPRRASPAAPTRMGTTSRTPR